MPDAVNNRLILFGGFTGDACVGVPPLYNDVWVLTNADGTATCGWIQLSPSGTPPSPRAMHAAAYDPVNNRMIVFGGDLNVGNCYGCVNDTWVLSNANGIGGTPVWTQLSAGGSPPELRQAPRAVYDPNSNRLIVYGGNVNSCQSYNSGAVWVLTNANGLGGTPGWMQLSVGGDTPAPHSGQAMVYDDINNRLIIHGGNVPNVTTNDVWVLEHANGLGGTPVWTRLSPAPPLPPPTHSHTAVYDAVQNRMVIFGGDTPGGTTDQVWVLANANGLGGTPAWTNLNPDAPLPPVRRAHAAGYNPATQRMTIYGGNHCPVMGDAWVLSEALGGVVWLNEIKMYAGIKLYGPAGATFNIQYSTNLADTNAWTTLTNATLLNSPFLFIDFGSPASPNRFYRSEYVP